MLCVRVRVSSRGRGGGRPMFRPTGKLELRLGLGSGLGLRLGLGEKLLL